ncbi:hypothetical protein HUG15_11825 [Salicibibacter cibarius]|uniref:Uncharacterized protein n=1 Tax=Salicibibacter cibarius TaxID=2743000 RepID=A0A7T6Z3G3_9BACI|nr:hypothetical protein HUG15_11825 [Salicibibacter cibarius]
MELNIEAVLVILLTAVIGVSADLFEIRPVYIIGSFAFLTLGSMINLVVFDNSKSKYYTQKQMGEGSVG